MNNFLKRNIFVALLAVAGLVSCTDEELVNQSKSNAFGFQIETDSEWYDAEASASRGIVPEEPMTITDKSGSQVLYLHRYSENNLAVDSETPETRGIPVTNVGSLSSVHKDMAITAYVGGKLLFARERVPVSATGFGSLSSRYWPQTEVVDFLAQSPYTVSGMSALTTSGKVARFSYTLPKTTNSTDAEKQADILLAQKSSSKAMSNNGNVALRFNHALSAIRFVTRDIAGGTVQKISLKNMYGSGSCVYDVVAANKFTWTVSGAANNIYSQMFNVAVNDQLSGAQQLTDKNKATTFMMIPQTLPANAQIEVVIATKNGGTHTLNGSIGGAKWEPGKIYTYTISTTSINWTYVLEVPNQTAQFKAVSHNYTVTSYRYRTNNPGYKENVSWTATFTGGKPAWITNFTASGAGSQNATTYNIGMTEQELVAPNSGNNAIKARAVVGSDSNRRDLSMFDASCNRMGSRNTANCYVVNAPGYYKFPLVPGNAIKNGAVNRGAFVYTGTAHQYWNPALNKNVIDEWNFGGGRFLLGARIGGTTSQGVDDRAYMNLQFGNNIEKAFLIWQDSYGVIEDVRLVENNQYIAFNVDPQKKNISQCNAIIGLKLKNSPQLVWSWHIWVTNVNLNSGIIPIDEYGGTAGKYKLAPYELGWCEAKPTNHFPERNQNIVFTQSGGKSVTMLFKNIGKQLQKTQHPNVTYYQFGRKDPMLALVNHDNVFKEQFGTPGYEFRCSNSSDLRSGGAPYVEDGPGKPNVMFVFGDILKDNKGLTFGDVYNVSPTCLWNNSTTTISVNIWDSEQKNAANPNGMYMANAIKKSVIKTVYDPSPVGFSLPPKDAFRIFIDQGASSNNVQGKLNGFKLATAWKWKLYPKASRGGTAFEVEAFGARGYKKVLSGGVLGGAFNRSFIYWMTADNLTSNRYASSCFAVGEGSGKYEYQSMSVSSRAIAKAVRPIREM